MMKNKARGRIVLLVVFVVLTIVLLVIPVAKTTAFWISYAFTALSFAAQIPIWNIGFKNGESLKSKFLGLPIVHIGMLYLIIQSLSTVAFRFALVQTWMAVIVSLFIGGVFSVMMISSQVARDEINRVEDKTASKVNFIRRIQCDVEVVSNAETDPETKKSLEDLAEKIRFSDPMSDEQLKTTEDKIAEKIKELKSADNKTVLIGEINALLAERNSKAKILK